MTANYIESFIESTSSVFSTMLGCDIECGELSSNANFQPEFDVSGIIGLTGKASGTVIVSLDQQVALSMTGALMGEVAESIDSNVIDAVGELTNMIAGMAKSKLSQLDMRLALPTVITGKDHLISFGSGAETTCIPCTCKWGKFNVEVGLQQSPVVEPSAP